MVDEPQLPAIGAVSIDGQSRREGYNFLVRTIRSIIHPETRIHTVSTLMCFVFLRYLACFSLPHISGGPYVPPLCAVIFSLYYMVKDVYPAPGTGSWRGHMRILLGRAGAPIAPVALLSVV